MRMSFRFLNIPVHIQPTFLVFFLLFTRLYSEFSLENGILGVILVFSLLVHEYGHALTARYFGAEPEITLEAFGGNARYRSRKLTAAQEFWITINGPLFESFLIFIPYFILKNVTIHNYYFGYFLYVMMKINIVWVLFNLIPVYPLDGGRIVRQLLESKWGEKGLKVSIFVGVASAAGLVWYYLISGYFIFAALLVIYGFRSFQHMRFAKQKPSAFSLLNKGLEELNNNQTAHAKEIFKKLLKVKDRQIQLAATESLARAFYLENDTHGAYTLLLSTDHTSLKSGKVLLCKLAYAANNFSLVAKHAHAIYEIEPTREIALLNAKAFAQLNEPAHAAGWLHTASLFDSE